MKFKIYSTLFLFLIALLHFNCKKEKMTPIVDTWKEDHEYWGASKVLKNGELWDFECYTKKSIDYPNKFGLVLDHYDANRQLRGTLHFRHTTFNIGKFFPPDIIYEFGTDSDSLFTFSYFSLQYDGDVIGDKYVSKNDSSVVFTLDKYDITTGEIWGTYSAHLVKDTSSFGELDKNSPYEIKFENGTFHTRVK
jgi:hypothetical protein